MTRECPEQSVHASRRLPWIPVILAFFLWAGILTAFPENLPDGPAPQPALKASSPEEIPAEELLKASSVDEAGALMYLELEDHIEVLQYIGNSLEVTVPETIAGKPVTHISLERFASDNTVGQFQNAGGYFTGIRKVILPKTTVKLTRDAFYGLQALEEIRGLEYVQELGTDAFSGCILQEVGHAYGGNEYRE